MQKLLIFTNKVHNLQSYTCASFFYFANFISVLISIILSIEKKIKIVIFYYKKTMLFCTK